MSVTKAQMALCLAVLAGAVAGGCSGNIGTGSGLPQPPGSQVSPGAAPQSRQRTTDGVVYLTSDSNEIQFPSIGGFGLTVYLSEPSAAPSPGPSGVRRTSSATAPAAAPSPSPVPSPAASPARNAKASATAAPGPKIDTKTVVYPEDAPAAPTPRPTGNVQSFPQRRPIVRAVLMSQTDLTIYSLAAVRFKVAPEEQTAARSFIVAIFESKKHRKQSVVAWSAQTAVADGTLYAKPDPETPLKLKKNTGYSFVLYGDELPPTPVPVASGYPTPSNRFGSPGPYPSGVPTPFGMTPAPAGTPGVVPRP